MRTIKRLQKKATPASASAKKAGTSSDSDANSWVLETAAHYNRYLKRKMEVRGKFHKMHLVDDSPSDSPIALPLEAPPLEIKFKTHDWILKHSEYFKPRRQCPIRNVKNRGNKAESKPEAPCAAAVAVQESRDALQGQKEMQ